MEKEKIINLLINGKDDKKAEGFVRFLSEKLWGYYTEYLMNKETIGKEEVSRWRLDLPNAKENVPYEKEVTIKPLKNPLLEGIDVQILQVKGISEDSHGLSVDISEDGKAFRISGTPSLDSFRKDGTVAESTFDLTIVYKFTGIDFPDDEQHIHEQKYPFVINQDPRKLWKNLDVDWQNMPEPKYYNEDTQADFIKVEALPDGTPQKDIVAASKRGRSHAQEAKPRDDHFKMYHDDNTNWYVMAVADGAGSAKFSRQGSTIACDTVIEHCKTELSNSESFEENINQWHANLRSEEAGKLISADIYRIVGNAAYKAHKAIVEEAKATGNPTKAYATTLLLAICKKFDFGWFVASFWVGDGAMCLYDRNNHTSTLLGIPDEGEYAGQTRFLTMPDIFNDTTEFYKRLKCKIVPDFTALFLMTDGVSDPKFETDANLNNPDKWDELWNDLQNNTEHPVNLSDNNENAQNELLDWLDFWSPGNHDDRTIAILY